MRLSTPTRLAALLVLCALAAGSAEPTVIPGDSAPGAPRCSSASSACAAMPSMGSAVRSDSILRGWSATITLRPSSASTMWNNAPVMWTAMASAASRYRNSVRTMPPISSPISTRRAFQDGPGDAARGKETFAFHQCGVCHGIEESRAENAPAVIHWESLADPVTLVRQMWNHGSQMRQSFSRRHVEWQTLTTAELEDLLAYLGSQAQTRGLVPRFSNTSGKGGNRVFTSKGCANCRAAALWRWTPAAPQHDAHRYRRRYVESCSANDSTVAGVIGQRDAQSSELSLDAPVCIRQRQRPSRQVRISRASLRRLPPLAALMEPRRFSGRPSSTRKSPSWPVCGVMVRRCSAACSRPGSRGRGSGIRRKSLISSPT